MVPGVSTSTCSMPQVKDRPLFQVPSSSRNQKWLHRLRQLILLAYISKDLDIMWVGGPWKSISLGLHNRFVDQILPPLPKVSGKQETAPLQPYTDTQSSDSKLDRRATWRLHHVCAEAVFTLPYSGLSGLRPFVTRGCLPARAEPAPVCQ